MSDDLDAFFEEVSEVEAKAVEEEDKEPPTKKQKLVRPLGVVVAAAASSTTTNTTKKQAADAAGEEAPPAAERTKAIPPPPPPPKAASSTNGPSIGPPPPPPTVNQQKSDNIDDWPAGGFRLFIGNLGNEVGDKELMDHFSKYPSLQRGRVIRDKKSGASKGFGFLCFGDPLEGVRAKREMDQSWLSSRPIRIKKYDGVTQQKKGKRRK